MKKTRRNVLAGLGGLTIAGGALFGTGAFTQVEAERSVSVTTAGDGSALLAFSADTSYNGVSEGDSTNNIVDLDFVDINENAITTFENVLTITNNGSSDVDLSVSGAPNAITFEDSNGNDLTNTTTTITAGGGTVQVTAVIDLINNSEPGSSSTITFTANSI